LIGETELASWCAGLLSGTVRYDDPAYPVLTWLGGAHAASLSKRQAFGSRNQEYWPRVWGARGLLHVWAPDARRAVIAGLSDPAWRVREMSAKIVRAQELADAETELAALVADPVPRVRAAALLSMGRVGESEHAEMVARSRSDSSPLVRRAAEKALEELAGRLDLRFRE
jgi:HEAT repeat protein